MAERGDVRRILIGFPQPIVRFFFLAGGGGGGGEGGFSDFGLRSVLRVVFVFTLRALGLASCAHKNA